MQEILSSNPPVVTGICDPNKSRARHHRSLKLGSKLKYLNKMILPFSSKTRTCLESKSKYFRQLVTTPFVTFPSHRFLQIYSVSAKKYSLLLSDKLSRFFRFGHIWINFTGISLVNCSHFPCQVKYVHFPSISC